MFRQASWFSAAVAAFAVAASLPRRAAAQAAVACPRSDSVTFPRVRLPAPGDSRLIVSYRGGSPHADSVARLAEYAMVMAEGGRTDSALVLARIAWQLEVRDSTFYTDFGALLALTHAPVGERILVANSAVCRWPRWRLGWDLLIQALRAAGETAAADSARVIRASLPPPL
jgi:hypothetical protein